jgi:hypothetical protein
MIKNADKTSLICWTILRLAGMLVGAWFVISGSERALGAALFSGASSAVGIDLAKAFRKKDGDVGDTRTKVIKREVKQIKDENGNWVDSPVQ